MNNIKLDLANAIYRSIQSKNYYLNRQDNKEEFFIQCLLEFMYIKKIEYLIIKNSVTFSLEIEQMKLYFWIFEIPEVEQEAEYIEYLCKELIGNFYYS